MGIILNFDFVLPIIIYLKINDFLIEQIYKGIKKRANMKIFALFIYFISSCKSIFVILI